VDQKLVTIAVHPRDNAWGKIEIIYLVKFIVYFRSLKYIFFNLTLDVNLVLYIRLPLVLMLTSLKVQRWHHDCAAL
jgi:hypothetical protein